MLGRGRAPPRSRHDNRFGTSRGGPVRGRGDGGAEGVMGRRGREGPKGYGKCAAWLRDGGGWVSINNSWASSSSQSAVHRAATETPQPPGRLAASDRRQNAAAAAAAAADRPDDYRKTVRSGDQDDDRGRIHDDRRANDGHR